MAAQTGLVLIKTFPYRGDLNEEFSNKYHFTGSVPADATAWRALFDALVVEEKKLYTSAVHVIKGYAYATDNPADDSVWSVDLRVSPDAPVAGTLTPGASSHQMGDTAVWVRWKTSRNNTNGKAIYLRKYFHDVFCVDSVGGADAVVAAQKTALTNFGTKLMDGTFSGGRKITAMGHDDVITATGASSYATTRTLKRRGKRPGA